MLPQSLEEYIEQFTSAETEQLRKINRATHLQEVQPHMLSGQYQGVLLQQISMLKQPNYILEIGTFTGYSALCLAVGLQPGGELHTIDVNEEVMETAKANFVKSEYSNSIITHLGDAKQIIPSLSKPFDLVFIDADKASYSDYFDLLIEQMPKGGVILADNVLWKGKVLQEKKDNKTSLLHAFNVKVQQDDRVMNCLLPIRDGLMLITKK